LLILWQAKDSCYRPVNPALIQFDLTNAHSKKIENHAHAFALHGVFYNFAKINQALRVPPAMEAGIADHVWAIEEIALLAAWNPLKS
jgi:hypothetical protein